MAGVSSENDLLHGKKSQKNRIRQTVCDAEEDLKGSGAETAGVGAAGVGTAAHWNMSGRGPGEEVCSRHRWEG